MINSNKAQGLSLNVVIIAVLLLIVLAVVIFVFFKGTNTFSGGISSCNDCQVTADKCPAENDEGKTVIAVFNKCKTIGNGDGNYCCTPLG
jgi:flagellar basal body-associated protein FliL